MSSADVANARPPSRYLHVDGLRAFAVMLVVVSHSGLGAFVPGGSGVTIFFSISGFVITSLLLREHARTGAFSARKFYLRRTLKIAPPFFIIIVVPTFFYAAFVHPVNYRHLLAQVFFTYNWLLAFGRPDYLTLPGSAVVWSLAIEEQFYIVFACFWLLTVRRKNYLTVLTVGATVVVIASTLVRAILSAHGVLTYQDRIYYGSDTRADGLALGILTAVVLSPRQDGAHRFARLRRWMSSDWTLVLAVAIFLISLVMRDPAFRNTFRYTLQSLATCAVIMYGFGPPAGGAIRRLFVGLARNRVVQFIGRASYSIYLIHEVLIFMSEPLMPGVPRVTATCLDIIMAVLAGGAVYLILERPFERLRAHLN